MKKFYQLLTLSVVAVISFKCQKEFSWNNKIPSQATNQSSPIISTVQGNVLNENGQPEAGVKISAGSKVSVTNSHGYFRIADALLDKNASLVIAEQTGYFKAYRIFSATTGVNQVVIKLIKKNLAGTIDATIGGGITVVNGAKVSLPANGVSKATGGVYTGSINVYVAYIDPTSNDIGKTIPGSFIGDDKDKRRVVLSSYGMLAVELESSSGEKLQIASGSAATLTMPVPSSILSSAPATISLWYVDEQTGIWKEEGTAKKNGINYTGEVKHFSYWNCDISMPAINFSATFKTSDGMALKNIFVRVKPATDSGGRAYGYTDSLGQVSGLIPANKNLVLEVLDQCYNVVYSKNIGPFNENINLGTIVISSNVPSLITVKGKLLSCSNAPVSNGYVIITWDNIINYIGVNDKGEFSTSFFTCAGIPHTCEILGVDEVANQQGTLLTVPLSQVTDAGNISACGISSTQFINYTLDGKDYNISFRRDDSSIVAYRLSAGTSFTTYVQGHNSAGDPFNFNFTSDAKAGVYPINSLYVGTYNRIVLTKPFTVDLTAYPQLAGEFYEGSFSGSFIDSSIISITHNINCSFRVKTR